MKQSMDSKGYKVKELVTFEIGGDKTTPGLPGGVLPQMRETIKQ